MDEQLQLTRRERQIMDIVYAREEASATEVLNDMIDAPARVSVRTLLRILEEKGHLTHYKKSREFIYQPVRSRERVGRSALERVLNTFFEGSLGQAITAHLSSSRTKLSAEELRKLEQLIRKTREGEES